MEDFEESPVSMASCTKPRGLWAQDVPPPTDPWKWGGAIGAWVFSPAQVDALNLKPETFKTKKTNCPETVWENPSQSSPQKSPRNGLKPAQKWPGRAPKQPRNPRNGLGEPRNRPRNGYKNQSFGRNPEATPEMVWESSTTSPGMVCRAKALNWFWTS